MASPLCLSSYRASFVNSYSSVQVRPGAPAFARGEAVGEGLPAIARRAEAAILHWNARASAGRPFQDCGVTAASLPVKETVRVRIPASDQFSADTFYGARSTPTR